MKKQFVLFALAAFLALPGAFAQYNEAPAPSSSGGFQKDRLFFGGNFGLSFGTYTLINVSPQLGYRFSDLFAAGAGVNYIHYGYKDDYQKNTQSYAGLNVFGRLYPIRQFFLQAQPELNYVWGNVKYYGGGQDVTQKIPSQFVPSLMLGGGAAIPAGRGAITISVLYDVIQNVYSPYYHQAVYGFGYISSF